MLRSTLSIFAADPSPAATERPWPSDPVAASANGKPTCGCGWPSIGLSMARSDSASSRVIGRPAPRSLCLPIGVITPPRSAYAAYRIGTACPSDSTSRSAAGFHGSLGSQRMWSYISTVIRWASDSAVDGCPLPAAVVISTDNFPISTALAWMDDAKLMCKSPEANSLCR
jgi:hypothetical protein